MGRPDNDDGQKTAIQTHNVAGAERPLLTFTLRVVGGPDSGKEFVLGDSHVGRVLVGTSPACLLSLSDPTVSRRHIALELSSAGVRLTDLDSTNGTFVNGLRVFDAELSGGETLLIGASVLRVEAGHEVQSVTSTETRFGSFIGGSPEIRLLYPTMARIAQSDIPVVIEGETGTGKEVLAESIHERSARASGPFVVFDCTTVAASLMEAALFGYEKGAFTGAVNASAGLFEQADKGTLFIDEIGDLDIALQAKLLRAIERSEVRRIGGKGMLRVDIRIIAATRRDLDKEVEAGRFRDDLFFRLAVARIEVPPLRRRKQDIPLLAATFWKEMGGAPSALTGDVISALQDYGWPGNVRELRNAIAQKLALGEFSRSRHAGRAAKTSDPSDPMQGILDADLPFPMARDRMLELFEQRYVARVLEQHGGNVTHAAQASGIGRRYFQTIHGRTK